MRSKNVLPIVFVVVFTSASIYLQAEEQRASNRSDQVAVVDVDRLLQSHCGLKRALAVLQKEQASFDKELKTEQERLAAISARLARHASDTQEHRDLKEQISSCKGELKLKIESHEKQVSQREASAYYDAYLDITRIVAEFSVAHGINMVLNADKSTIESDEPVPIMKRLENQFVYQCGLDITEFILRWHPCDVCRKHAADLARKDSPPTASLEVLRQHPRGKPIR